MSTEQAKELETLTIQGKEYGYVCLFGAGAILLWINEASGALEAE